MEKCKDRGMVKQEHLARIALAALGMTQRDLVRAVGTSPARICRLLGGAERWTAPMARRIGAALGQRFAVALGDGDVEREAQMGP